MSSHEAEAALAAADQLDLTFFEVNPAREFRARRALQNEALGRAYADWVVVRCVRAGRALIFERIFLSLAAPPLDSDALLFAVWMKVKSMVADDQCEGALALLPHEAAAMAIHAEAHA